MLAINPKGQVPVLIDDDLSLYDSTLILEYLEDPNPEPPLYPLDIKERARCRQLEAAADEIFFPNVWELIAEVFYKSDPAQRDGARIEKAQAALRGQYEQLDRLLDGREFLCRQFTVADIGYFLTTMFATSLGAAPSDAHPNVLAWSARVGSRPSVGREVEGMTAVSQQR
jgi:glutathione S-transferase